LSIRSTENEGKRYIEGIIPYNSKSVPMWGLTEIIDRSAFNKTLNDNSEVRALWNHNDSHVLGNTKSGTLQLENSDDGLMCRCELPNTTYAADLYEIVNRGDVKTMSFGFRTIKDTFSQDGKTRTLKEAALEEVSFGVTFPAYPETTSQTLLRSYCVKRNINMESIEAIIEKIGNQEELTDDEKTELSAFVKPLNDVLSKEEEAAKEEPADATPEEDTSTTENQDELDLIQTAIELEILDIDELKEEVQKAKEE
jgi:HK97 family phage prohead protease